MAVMAVRAVSFNNNDIQFFDTDPAWPSLQYLNLGNNNLEAVPLLPRCPDLRQVLHCSPHMVPYHRCCDTAPRAILVGTAIPCQGLWHGIAAPTRSV